MTRTMGFPTTDFPGPPPFRFELPGGWRAMPSTRADAVVVGPDAADGVHPNVVIANHKVRPTDDPATLLRTMVDQQVQRPDVQIGAGLQLIDNERACTVRFTRLALPDDETTTGDGAVAIEQSLNLCYIHGPQIAHVLAATGTYAPSSDESRHVVDSVINSVEY